MVAHAVEWREDIMAVDPVCKMTVEENKAAATSEYGGKKYYFCAVVCKTRFEREPQKYVKQD
jgi:YHS domain-containing protein